MEVGGGLMPTSPLTRLNRLSPQTVTAVVGRFEGEAARIRDGGQPLGGVGLICQRLVDF